MKTAQTLSTLPFATRNLPTLRDVDVYGKRVLLRADYNVTVRDDGTLVDDTRLRASLPTLKYLLEQGARVGVLTHLGRPGGRVVPPLSTAPLAKALAALLGQSVDHVPDCVGRVAESAMDALAPGHVLMFENTRFHLAEQLNQAPFVQQLTRLGDVFVNDAFATAHRPHASTSGLAGAMPISVIGLLMLQELEWLERVALKPEKPFCMVLGGSGVDMKLHLLRHMLGRVDTVLLGGAIANTFMAARDLGMGQSLLSPSHVDAARELLTEAGVVGCRLHLPLDVWVHDAAQTDKPAEVRPAHGIGSNETVLDIGPRTLELWEKLIADSGTTLFSGSLGITEHPEGARASLGLLHALAAHPRFSLVGGTGILPLVAEQGLGDSLPAVSTAGAALIEGLCGKPYPCLQVLEWKRSA